MLKKVLVVLFSVIIIAGIIILYFLLSEPSSNSESSIPSKEKQLIGGGKDKHGCLTAAGYSWCEEKQKCLRVWEEGCDQITTLLTRIKSDTQVELTSLKDVSFDWYMSDTKNSAVLISGYSIEAYNVSDDDFTRIKAYFADNSYELDVFNNSAATTIGIAAYRKDQVVCLLISAEAGGINKGDSLVKPEAGTSDVQIKCGLIN